jgi:hypothetical protein
VAPRAGGAGGFHINSQHRLHRNRHPLCHPNSCLGLHWHSICSLIETGHLGFKRMLGSYLFDIISNKHGCTLSAPIAPSPHQFLVDFLMELNIDLNGIQSPLFRTSSWCIFLTFHIISNKRRFPCSILCWNSSRFVLDTNPFVSTQNFWFVSG